MANAKLPRHLYMCPPDYFEVTYIINNWMDPDAWAADEAGNRQRVKREWEALKAAYEQAGHDIYVIPPEKGLPDMVFAANAGFILDGRVIPARFRHAERRPERAHFSRFFDEEVRAGRLAAMISFPDDIVFEGTGDAIYDPVRDLVWFGAGARSSPDAAPLLEKAFGRAVVMVKTGRAGFYHLDTCLMPLSGRHLLLVEEAFEREDLARIRDIAGKDNIIALPPDDAQNFAANSVSLGRDIFCGPVSGELEGRLREKGYYVNPVNLPVFRMAGGSAFCLTLMAW